MSRNEEILQAIIDGQVPEGVPQSRNEALLMGVASKIDSLANEAGSGSINDTTPSTTTTYSSAKIEGEVSRINNDLTDVDSQVKSIATNPDTFGAKGDGVTDDTLAIQAAIDASNNKVYFTRGKTYCISSTVFIPEGIEIDFNLANILPITGGTFVNGYVFGLNTNDCVTWKVVYSSKMNTLRNLIADNTNLLNVCLFFVASPLKAKNISTRRFYSTFKYSSNLYIDYRYFENINIVDNMGTEYAIVLGGQGDNIHVKGVHCMKYLNDANLKAVRVAASGGCHIDQPLNGDYYIYNCTNVSMTNIHMERGIIEVINSQVSIENGYMWKESDIYKITIKDEQTSINADVSLPCTIRNVLFKLRYTDKRYQTDIEDIDISNYKGSLILENVNRACEPSGGDYSKKVITGITLKTGAATKVATIKSRTVINKKIVEDNGALYTSETDGYFSLAAVSLTNDGITPWRITEGTYHYRVCLLFDDIRKIGITNPSSSASVVKSNTMSGNNMAQLFLGSNVNGVNLRIYRGSTNTVFEKYVDIPFVQSRFLIDTGEDINGYAWKDNENTSYAYYPVNSYQKVEYIGLITGNVRVYGTAIPTVGTWKQGDIIYNTNPVASGNIGWVCVVEGTSGVWKPFGVISS